MGENDYIYYMKKLLFILFLSPLFCAAQYRESGDTIFFNNKVIVPGDTIHLGMGSDPYKNFLFVSLRPNGFNSSVSSDGISTKSIERRFAYTFAIYKGMSLNEKRTKKFNSGYPIFYLMGYKGPYNTCYIQFPAAAAVKEIII